MTLELSVAASTIEVVAATPLAGTDLTPEQIAVRSRRLAAADVENSGALEIGDFMNRRLNGVYLNEMQGNPFQPDVNFRGYTASPLLGTPEGISVYLDGVRQNQPFGDVVSWDLIPKNAISEITLIPGSDPLFGLNTLGGALSVQTKDGVANPGVEGNRDLRQQRAQGGSGRIRRRQSDGLQLVSRRERVPRVGLAFRFAVGCPPGICPAWVAYRQDRSCIHHLVRLQHADRKRTAGLSSACTQLFERLFHPRQYCRPLAVVQSHRPPRFQRQTDVCRQRLVSQYQDGGSQCESEYGLVRSVGVPAEYQRNRDPHRCGLYRYSSERCDRRQHSFPEVALHCQRPPQNDPDERCDGIIIYSKQVQNEYGLSGQVTWLTSPRIGRNQFAAGAALDRGSVKYTQNTQYGYLNPNYTITGVPAWRDGSTSNPVDSVSTFMA